MFILNKPSGLSNKNTYIRTILEFNWKSPLFKIMIQMCDEYNNIQVQYMKVISLNKEESKRDNA